MPLEKVDETYKRLCGSNDLTKLSVTSNVIDIVSDFFAVSKQSAAIRMLELGYQEAEEHCGSDATNNDRKPRSSRKGSTAKYHLRPITRIQALNCTFQTIYLKPPLDTGAFHFADGYFVLNDSKYLQTTPTGKKH